MTSFVLGLSPPHSVLNVGEDKQDWLNPFFALDRITSTPHVFSFRGLNGLPLTRQRCYGILVPSFWHKHRLGDVDNPQLQFPAVNYSQVPDPGCLSPWR